MAKNILVINVDIRETRVALIENGIIAELHMERHGARGTLGNIYLGKVSRVLPGMQAAFIDIGQERAAFLHVEDLIRPDDFEAYLSGKRGRAAEEEGRPAAHDHEVPVEPAHDDHQHDEVAADGPAAGDEVEEPDGEEPDGEEPEVAEPGGDDELAAADDDDSVELEIEIDAADEDEPLPIATVSDAEPLAHDVAPEVLPEPPPPPSARRGGARERRSARMAEAANEASLAAAAVEPASHAEADPDGDAEEGDAEEGEAVQVAGADGDVDPTLSPEDAAALRAPRARTRRGGRGRKRRGTTRPDGVNGSVEMVGEPGVAQATATPVGAEVPPRGQDRARGEADRRGRAPRSVRGQAPQKAPLPPPQKQGKAPQGGRLPRGRQDGRRSSSRSATKDPLRVSKSTPIRDVVREGQEVVVQVSKEPIGTKGARVTSHISLPGRYVVYLPTVEHVGISKRIGSDKERSRLREAIEAMKPPQGGLIVRTLAEGLTKKSLKADVGYLVRLWGEIAKNRESASRAPASLYAELDLVLKTARDLFTDDIEKIVIDDKDEYLRLRRFVEMFMPERVGAIELYEGDEPIFDEYGIEEEIGRAISRKVPLNSGGHLIIDQAEALTAIDVNTGRFVGKGSKDLEDTILQTNLEAVEEIAYQLRFRNIGGLIILDLIDMERIGNREKVRRKLETLLAKDKAKTTLNRISDLGLIEMTRKRTRESLGRFMNEPCFYCDGTGNLQSRQTIAYEILRQIKRDRANLRGYSVVINAHPAVIDFLKNEERGAVAEAERRYTRRIELAARKEYHLEQFDLVGK